MNEIWILGANGRCGRAVASELAARQQALVLVGRDAGRLRDAANAIGGNARVVVADSIDDIAERIARSEAAVVVNTIGPFTRTALPIARACPRGCHYLDIANEFCVQWSDGRVREGWMRAGEAMAFTNAVTTAVALRLAGNEGRPGAYTPGALFGPDLAVQAGGQFIVSMDGGGG